MDGSTDMHPVQIVPRKRVRPPMEIRVAHWLRNNFVIPSGISAGKPFELHPFQLEILGAYFSRDPDGPTWRTLIFSTPRKQGKTMLMAALLLALMCPDSPAHVPNFKGSIAAPTERHTLFVPKSMQDLMDAAGRSKELQRKSDPKPGIVFVGNATLLLSTGTRSQGHGADLDLVILDECGLLTRNQSEMVTGFNDAVSARDGQVLLTGTRGDSPFYNDLIDRPDKRTFVCLYAADKGDDMADPLIWQKRTPA